MGSQDEGDFYRNSSFDAHLFDDDTDEDYVAAYMPYSFHVVGSSTFPYFSAS